MPPLRRLVPALILSGAGQPGMSHCSGLKMKGDIKIYILCRLDESESKASTLDVSIDIVACLKGVPVVLYFRSAQCFVNKTLVLKEL